MHTEQSKAVLYRDSQNLTVKDVIHIKMGQLGLNGIIKTNTKLLNDA